MLVGELYPRDDARRDPAFSIFYMGINAGGAIGPLVCGLFLAAWGIFAEQREPTVVATEPNEAA